jgi:hypothetical protein
MVSLEDQPHQAHQAQLVVLDQLVEQVHLPLVVHLVHQELLVHQVHQEQQV